MENRPCKNTAGLKGTVPVVSLIAAVILTTALAQINGGSFFTARFDIFRRASEPVSADLGGSADGFEERFGIRLVKDKLVIPSAYSAEDADGGAETAEAEIGAFLGELPDGFTKKLAEGYPGGIIIELTGGLRAREAGYIDDPSALTFSYDGAKVIALDVRSGPIAPTLAHELCHIVDERLTALAALDRSHWSESGWARLNPEGFGYYGAYIDESGLPYYVTGDAALTLEGGGGEVYFINRYARTSPSEDRAELIEALVRCGPGAYFLNCPRLRAKLDYYIEAVKYYLGFEMPPYS